MPGGSSQVVSQRGRRRPGPKRRTRRLTQPAVGRPATGAVVVDGEGLAVAAATAAHRAPPVAGVGVHLGVLRVAAAVADRHRSYCFTRPLWRLAVGPARPPTEGDVRTARRPSESRPDLSGGGCRRPSLILRRRQGRNVRVTHLSRLANDPPTRKWTWPPWELGRVRGQPAPSLGGRLG